METMESGMSGGDKALEIKSVPLSEVAEDLRQSRPFGETNFEELRAIERVDRVTAKAGSVLVESGDVSLSYWLVLSGKILTERPEPDGSLSMVGLAEAGEGFGEAPLLMGKTRSVFRVSAVEDCVLLRFTDEQFWALLACCSKVRKVVLANNDIYTADDLANDWILTCQGHCFGAEVEITYDVV